MTTATSARPPASETTSDKVDLNGTLTLLVRQMTWQSEGVMTLVLEDAAGADLPQWTPGAHLDLHLPGAIVRQYSLCGDPLDRQRWRVAVLLEQVGRGGSRAVHRDLRPGMVLTARGPRNNFELRPAGAYRFVAGGIGITPILAMVNHARDHGTPWSLLYGGRSRGSMAFVEELPQGDGAGAGGGGDGGGDGDGEVTVVPQDEAGLLPLADLLADVEPNTLVYACGPGPLLDAIERATAHWPPGSLVLERFAPVSAPVPQGLESSFEVEAAASGVTVTVEPGTSIVRALESAGVYPETSCEEGICGTCETRVLAGTPQHRDSLLSEAERETGETMMICVSRCAGQRLVLDL